ncbi:MAG: hypothetical protein JXR53_09425 [Bacteroidales bacterium]|nr:hypothetical protein [Bacteroidales bacterium]
MLTSAYRNYKVSIFDSVRFVYKIEQVNDYTEARAFVRLIKYDSKGHQTNSITINDFCLTDYIIYDKGNVLALNNFGYGASRKYFREENYSYKIIWLDFDLNIRNCFYLVHESTQINGVGIKNNQIYG